MTDEIAKKFDRACAYMKVPTTAGRRPRMWGQPARRRDINDDAHAGGI
jgi:hypothetical protein